MNKPFTKMLAELNIFLGNKRITPSSSTEVDALDDDKDDPVGGEELSSEDCDCGTCAQCTGEDKAPQPSPDEISDLDDTTTDLSKLSLDQIIAALQAIKAQQDGPKDFGGDVVEPHSDFADQDPNSPPEHLNPADNRMPDDGPVDDDSIPMLPGLRKSVEDEQLLKKPSKGPFDDEDDEDDPLADTDAAKRGQEQFQDEDGSEDGSVDLEKNDAQGEADDLGLDGEANPGAPGEQDDSLSMGSEDETDQPDENHMGSLRTVKGAHLVYKRQAGDGTFTELWSYGIGEHINDAIGVKKAILAGTDIPDNKMSSEDGSQSYELVTMGNAQLLQITGLPS